MGDHKRSGKKAVNRHQTQSKASAGAQERAIERVERQRAKKVIEAGVVEARSVTITDEWGHKKVVGGFGDVGGAKPDPKVRRQCAKCPWRTDVDPHDIPNGYCEVKHANLKDTIAEPGSVADLGRGSLRVMACHEFPEGRESPCVGWVFNQLGPGNNIALRMQALDGRFKDWKLADVEQHETFEDTLPRDRDE
jgi:hypothetical protein